MAVSRRRFLSTVVPGSVLAAASATELLALPGQAARAASGPGDVVGKITVGYQGWFACIGDGAPINGWWHWSQNWSQPPSPSNNVIKAWPDMRAYSTDNAFPQWLEVDLGTAAIVSRIVMNLPPSPAWGARTQTLQIQGSTDGTAFTTIAGSRGYGFDPASGNTATATFSATSARYLRLTFTANTGWPAGQLSEIGVFAS